MRNPTRGFFAPQYGGHVLFKEVGLMIQFCYTCRCSLSLSLSLSFSLSLSLALFFSLSLSRSQLSSPQLNSAQLAPAQLSLAQLSSAWFLPPTLSSFRCFLQSFEHKNVKKLKAAKFFGAVLETAKIHLPLRLLNVFKNAFQKKNHGFLRIV